MPFIFSDRVGYLLKSGGTREGCFDVAKISVTFQATLYSPLISCMNHCLAVLGKYLGDFSVMVGWAFWERDIFFLKDRLN